MDLFKTQSARELFAPEPVLRDSAWKTVAVALRRRKWAVACCLGIALVAGIVYTIRTPKLVETSSTVRVEVAAGLQPGMGTTTVNLLAEQPEVMRSTPVIALALASPELRGLPLLEGKKSRIEYIKSNLAIHSSPESGVYEMTFISNTAADAEKLLDVLINAYTRFENSPRPIADNQAMSLREQKQKTDDELAVTRNLLNDVLQRQKALSPISESRERLGRERAGLQASLVGARQKSDLQNAIRARLDLLTKRSQAIDALDEQAYTLQDELERMTSQSDELGERLRSWNNSRANQVAITLVKAPATNPSSVWPRPWPILGFCMLAGLLVGGVVALAIDRIADRLHDADDAASLARAPVLGRLPTMSPDLSSAVLRGQCVLVKPTNPAAQACREIRMALENLLASGIDKTILVTGPGKTDGKSMVASNLAIAMAKAGLRVALVDAHHHRPMANKIFAIQDYVGLNSAIDGTLNVNDALHVTGLPGLEVLPAGSSTADWSELLNRPEFLAVLTELAERFDRVIIDGGPSRMDETRIISAFCDATILTVDARRCRRRELKAAVEGLRAVGAKLVGIVMNDLPVHRVDVSTGLRQRAARRLSTPGAVVPRFAKTDSRKPTRLYHA